MDTDRPLKFSLNLLGTGYYSDSDILMLDISDSDRFVWMDVDPSPNLCPKPIAIGAIVGCLIGGIPLLLAGCFSYKWNKGRKEIRILMAEIQRKNEKNLGREAL